MTQDKLSPKYSGRFKESLHPLHIFNLKMAAVVSFNISVALMG